MLGVVSESAQRHGAEDRLGLGRDHGGDVSVLEPAEDLAAGVAGVRVYRRDRRSGPRRRGVEAGQNLLTFAHLAGRDLDVEHDAELVVDDAVLLVAQLEPAVAARRRH
jgi:hypothetical protein